MSISTVRKATISVSDPRFSDEQLATVQRYLPSNYSAMILRPGEIDITGTDIAGWTMDGYVIPRLASGLIIAKEVTA